MLPAFVAIIAAAHLNDCTGPAVANPVTVLEKGNQTSTLGLQRFFRTTS